MLALKVHLSHALVEHLLRDAVGDGEAGRGTWSSPVASCPPAEWPGPPLTVPHRSPAAGGCAVVGTGCAEPAAPGKLVVSVRHSRVPAEGLDTAPVPVLGVQPQGVQDLALRW